MWLKFVLNREVAEETIWMEEKLALVSSSKLESSLAEVNNLMQKHLLLETEIHSHDKVITQLVTKAEQMARSTNFAADDIKHNKLGTASKSMTERGQLDSNNIEQRMQELRKNFQRFRSEMAAKKQHLLDLKATFDFSLRPGKQFKSPYRDLNLPASASLGSLFVEKTQFPLNLMQVSPELW